MWIVLCKGRKEWRSGDLEAVVVELAGGGWSWRAADRSVELRAPASVCCPCGGRGRAVDIRYANELGSIELVLLGIKEGTNSMFPLFHLHSVYMYTNQPTFYPVARRVSPARCPSRLMRSE